MKAQQKTRRTKTGTIAKPGRLTFEGIGGLIKFRHHVAKPVGVPGSFSTLAVGGVRVEDKVAYELEAERRRAMTRSYSNMMPFR